MKSASKQIRDTIKAALKNDEELGKLNIVDLCEQGEIKKAIIDTLKRHGVCYYTSNDNKKYIIYDDDFESVAISIMNELQNFKLNP